MCLCVCIPDCSGAEGGRGSGGNVGVVLGVQLIINSILQGDKKTKQIFVSNTVCRIVYTHTSLSNHVCFHHEDPLKNWLCTNTVLNIVDNNQARKKNMLTKVVVDVCQVKIHKSAQNN